MWNNKRVKYLPAHYNVSRLDWYARIYIYNNYRGRRKYSSWSFHFQVSSSISQILFSRNDHSKSLKRHYSRVTKFMEFKNNGQFIVLSLSYSCFFLSRDIYS